MEKFNVVIDDEKTKTAGQVDHCPKCGAPLGKQYKTGREVARSDELPNDPGIPWCPNCGTEPWEKK